MSRTVLFIDAGYFDKLMLNAFSDQQGGRKVAMPLDYKRLGAALDLRHAIRVMNRVMEACERDDRKWPDQI